MRILKWIGIVLAGVVVLALAAFLYFRSAAQARLDKTYDIKADPIPIPYPLTEQELEALRAERRAAQPAPTEAAPDAGTPAPDPLAGVDLDAIARERAIARGKHYIYSRGGCPECHAEDFGGKVIIDNPAMGKWIAPNITRAGLIKGYKPEDWVRILRHGVKPDRHPATMPSLDFTWFSDQEVSDIAVFIESQPPVERVMPQSELGPIYTMLIGNGTMPISAEILDHTTPRAKLPPDAATPTLELGKHIVTTCTGCHGATLSGGPVIGGDPAWPPAKNITFHDTGLAKWSLADFKKAMREGIRPDGTKIALPMSVVYTSNFKDAEVEAMYLYLQSVEKKPFGNH